MRIGIIGCGWLGLPLATALIERGHHVIGTSTTATKLPQLQRAGIEAFLLDLNTALPDSLLRALYTCDRLFVSIPPGRGYSDVIARYPDWMRKLLAVDNGTARWVFTGSTGVYGRAEGRVDEQTPPRPERASPRAVLAAEQILRATLGDRLTVLRLAGLAGGGREPGRWLAGKKDIPGGDAPVNLVHRDDVSALSIATLEAAGPLDGCYNVCADLHPPKAAYYRARALHLGLEPPVFQLGGGNGKRIVGERIKAVFAYRMKWPDPSSFPV